MDRYDLLEKSQHTFYKGKSSLTILLEFLQGVNKHMCKGNSADILTLSKSCQQDHSPQPLKK